MTREFYHEVAQTTCHHKSLKLSRNSCKKTSNTENNRLYYFNILMLKILKNFMLSIQRKLYELVTQTYTKNWQVHTTKTPNLLNYPYFISSTGQHFDVTMGKPSIVGMKRECIVIGFRKVQEMLDWCLNVIQ